MLEKCLIIYVYARFDTLNHIHWGPFKTHWGHLGQFETLWVMLWKLETTQGYLYRSLHPLAYDVPLVGAGVVLDSLGPLPGEGLPGDRGL